MKAIYDSHTVFQSCIVIEYHVGDEDRSIIHNWPDTLNLLKKAGIITGYVKAENLAESDVVIETSTAGLDVVVIIPLDLYLHKAFGISEAQKMINTYEAEGWIDSIESKALKAEA